MLLSRAIVATISASVVLTATVPVLANNPNFPGYLGVYVFEDFGGMQISGFIPNTPADQLASMGEISEGDTIIRLGGERTRSLQELRNARNQIPMNMEAKMILRDRFGDIYHVWISRSAAMAAMARDGQQPRSMPDRFMRGGRGEGSDGDLRPERGDRAEGPGRLDDDRFEGDRRDNNRDRGNQGNNQNNNNGNFRERVMDDLREELFGNNRSRGDREDQEESRDDENDDRDDDSNFRSRR